MDITLEFGDLDLISKITVEQNGSKLERLGAILVSESLMCYAYMLVLEPILCWFVV